MSYSEHHSGSNFEVHSRVHEPFAYLKLRESSHTPNRGDKRRECTWNSYFLHGNMIVHWSSFIIAGRAAMDEWQ
jgi:hypothetical protein